VNDRGDIVEATRIRLTERLRLEPIGPQHVDVLWKLHQDDAIAEWFAGKWSLDEARSVAATFGEAWETEGVHKWIAYDRVTGVLIGRGGLSRITLGGQQVLEIGWSVLGELWGRGYATEIGRAGLAFAFEELDAERVVAFTEVHNKRSRAVMERLGMRYAGELSWRGLIEGLEGVHDNAPFALYELLRAG
jgi:RimJ/RimL family protein N-acetyltransferase